MNTIQIAAGDHVKIIATIQNETVIAAWGGRICRSVALSQERIAHINERHPGVYEAFRDDITATIEQPDYVVDDPKNVNTALFIRESGKTNLNVVVRLAIEEHPSGLLSSVITMYPMSAKRLHRLLRRAKLVYKAPHL